MNILAASAGNPQYVLDIVDSAKHMTEGGKRCMLYLQTAVAKDR